MNRKKEAIVSKFKVMVTDYAWPSLDIERQILDKVKLSYNTNSDDLSDNDVANIRKIIDFVICSFCYMSD